MSTVDEDLDRVGAWSLQYRHRRERENDWRHKRNVWRILFSRRTEVHLPVNLRNDWMPVLVNYLDAQLMFGSHLSPVERELRHQ